MPDVGGARAQREKGLAQVTAVLKQKLITDDHAQYTWQKTFDRETKELICHADGNGICKVEFGPM